jgi:hypothetical protein
MMALLAVVANNNQKEKNHVKAPFYVLWTGLSGHWREVIEVNKCSE